MANNRLYLVDTSTKEYLCMAKGHAVAWDSGNIDLYREFLSDRFNEIGDKTNLIIGTENDVDFFRINGVAIYKSGKWAKKLPKRVEVDPNSLDSISKAFNKCSDLETNKFKVFLAKQLEKYLNGEVE